MQQFFELHFDLIFYLSILSKFQRKIEISIFKAIIGNVSLLELRGGIWKRLASISVNEVMKTQATIQNKLAMSFSSCYRRFFLFTT